MKRTKFNTEQSRPKLMQRDMVKVANMIMLPNIWLQKSPTKIKRTNFMFAYGNNGCKAIVTTPLYEKDFGPWLNMLEMCRQNHYQKWTSDTLLLDIAKEMGYINPSKMASELWDSFDRLLDAQIRIRPENGKGFSAKFCLIEGFINSDGGHGSFGVSQYRDIITQMMLGDTFINIKIYLSIKGMIARSLYRFLLRQQPFYSGTGYEIRLSLLCQYLNYDSLERPWWEVWKTVKNAIEELIRLDIVSKYERDVKRYKNEGGIIKIYSVKKETKPVSTGNTNDELIIVINKRCKEKITHNYAEIDYRTGLNKIKVYLEEYTGKNYSLEAFKFFIEYYSKWIDDNDAIKFISPTLFSPASAFFSQHIKELKEDGMLRNVKQRKKDAEQEEEYKQGEEAREKEREMREQDMKHPVKECPYGFQFGIDYYSYESQKKCKACYRDYNCSENKILMENEQKQLPAPKSMETTMNTEKVCPHGYRFEIDAEAFDVCDTCNIWSKCVAEHERKKR